MLPIQIISPQSMVAMPWKNGGGTTRQVAVYPPLASLETFQWRVSVATIARDGPFSQFAGFDRFLVPLAPHVAFSLSIDGAPWHRFEPFGKP